MQRCSTTFLVPTTSKGNVSVTTPLPAHRTGIRLGSVVAVVAASPRALHCLERAPLKQLA